MHWVPPKVKMTPRLKMAYRQFTNIERNYTQTRNGKDFVVSPRIEKEIQLITETISEERQVSREIVIYSEPLFLEMGNSIITNVTKTQPFENLDESNSLWNF